MNPVNKVIIVDDHAIVREGLKSLINHEEDFEVIAEAESGTACLEILETAVPHIILMDLKMPGISGIESTRLIKSEYPQIKVLLLTNYDDEAYVLEAIKAGADGYVLKDVKKGDLIEILRKNIQNQAFIDPNVTRKLFDHLKNTIDPELSASDRPILTQRELEILTHLVEGQSNKEIANALFISLDTVKSHLKKIYQKLGAQNRSHAAKLAIQKRILFN
ncbi:MAG: response regulator transcription factor [Deltaproteobacteria bacterium]|nr:response regulator transcription factor [Deltaproteobacteria bacterium]